MVKIERTYSDVNIILSWDEAVRFGVALTAGCLGQSEEVFAKQVDITLNAVCLLSHVLNKKDCFVGEVGIATGGEAAFHVRVNRTVDSVSVVVSRGDAWRLRSLIEFRVESARSRSEYYLRTGLSRPLMEKILATITTNQNGSAEIPLEWGDGFLEAPPSPRPPSGTMDSFGWVVVRTDETEAGMHSFVVESVWKDVDDARRDLAMRNTEPVQGTIGKGSRRDMRIVAVTKPPSGAGFDVMSTLGAYVMGRVVGQDVGDEELYPGSVWWSEEDAAREATRWNAIEGAKIPSPYRVWASYFQAVGSHTE